MDDAKNIPLDMIHDPWIVLRPVRRDAVRYLQLRDSIRDRGLLNSISVRPSARHPGKYEIIDGNYRYHCFCDLGFDTIPCIIKEGVTDDDVLVLQIEANVLGEKTTPIELSRRLKRIMDSRPGMTFGQLASLVRKCPQWLKNRLGLLRLSEELQTMVDRGEMNLQAAYMLAKIPPDLRGEYVTLALDMPTEEFSRLAAGVIKKYREGVHQTRMDQRYQPDKGPQPHLRSLKTLLEELRVPHNGPLLLMAEGCETPMDGWCLALKWATHTDTQSIEHQKSFFRVRKRLKRKDPNDLDT